MTISSNGYGSNGCYGNDDDESTSIKKAIFARTLKSSFLLVALFGYLIFGAFVFAFLEYKTRNDKIEAAVEDLEEERAELLKVLWASSIANDEHGFNYIANERMDLYEKLLESYAKDKIDLEYPDDTLNPWTFTGSMFYCFSVVTTIGYGNMTPVTYFGKFTTILYACFGIPLMLMVLSEIGKMLTLALKFYIKKCRQHKVDASDEFNFNPTVAILLTFVYVFTGATVFSLAENWTLFDAGYFSFVTFSTIGFGDFVPSNPNIVLLIMLYDFTALAMCSMCFYSIQEKFKIYLNRALQTFENWLYRVRKSYHMKRLGNIVSNGFTKTVSTPLRNSSFKRRMRKSRFTEEEEEEEEETEEDVSI